MQDDFLDLTGVQSKDPVEYGQQMHQRVLKWLVLPVCVGIAPTKTLANQVAKKARNTTAHSITRD
jgi:DNA polymerase V